MRVLYLTQTILILLDGWLLESYPPLRVLHHQDGWNDGCLGHHLQAKRPHSEFTGVCNAAFFLLFSSVYFLLFTLTVWS